MKSVKGASQSRATRAPDASFSATATRGSSATPRPEVTPRFVASIVPNSMKGGAHSRSSSSKRSRYGQPGSVPTRCAAARSALVSPVRPDRGWPGPATRTSGSGARTSVSRPSCSVSGSIRKPTSYVPWRSACRVASPSVGRRVSRTFG
ncbi:hypothetical protein BN2537_9877 [Streptomyces venezuelae]|nr:hypothetical protein BN2537_9877 [Streptomyces venezuelae]